MMAAGDLITDDYHLELRGRLMGPGTRFDWAPPGWQGLGLPAWKTTDVDLEQGPGSFLGRDYLAARLLTFPVVWGGHGAEDVMLDLSDLVDTWAPSRSVDLELWGKLPGWGRFFVVGRPRGLVEDLSGLKSGEGAALLTFLAGDPTIYYPDAPGS